ncbi:MAG: LptF/LptG family permease [Bacteroidales bacterium]|nr:LptF/LptG family permease [Bacteroidales bacterium]
MFTLRSFLGPFFMTFFICVFVLLMQFLWKYIDDLVGKGLDLDVLAELLFYALLGLLPMAFPLSILLASIMSFGNLGENYELVAMKASGISLFRVMRPLILVALLLTGFAFYFSNTILPKANLKLTALMWSIRRQKPEMVIKEGIFTNDIDGYSIKVERKSRTDNMLYDILIYDHRANMGNVSVCLADSGVMEISPDKRFMVMTLYHGQTSDDERQAGGKDKSRPFRRTTFDKEIINVPLNGFIFQKQDESVLTNFATMVPIKQLNEILDSLYIDYNGRVRRLILGMQYGETLQQTVNTLSNPVDSMRGLYTVPTATRPRDIDYKELFDDMTQPERRTALSSALAQARNNKQTLDQNVLEMYAQKKKVNKYEIEIHNKFTMSLACIVFFFIGAPLGAIIRRGGLGMPVVVSIVLFIIYYVTSLIGQKFSREDIWPMFNGMWFSTFVFLPFGIFLTYKAVNDSGLLAMETYQNFVKRVLNLFRLKKRP